MLRAPAGNPSGMETIKYGGDNLWSPAREFPNNILML